MKYVADVNNMVKTLSKAYVWLVIPIIMIGVYMYEF